MKTLVLIVAAIGLSACAGRSPQPVALIQPTDQYMTCAAISVESQVNNRQVAELSGEEGSKTAQNVAAGVVGLFIWPVWFAMDFQGAADKEVVALQNRQQYLTVLAQQRHCGGPVAPQAR